MFVTGTLGNWYIGRLGLTESIREIRIFVLFVMKIQAFGKKCPVLKIVSSADQYTSLPLYQSTGSA